MDRNRERSGSGSSFSSLTGLTEGLRGAVRRSSVSQVVQAAVAGAGEVSPLRWVAEMVGWNPEDQAQTAGQPQGQGGGAQGAAAYNRGPPYTYSLQRHGGDDEVEGWRYGQAGGVNEAHDPLQQAQRYEPVWQIERRAGSRDRSGEVGRGNGGRRGTTG